MDVPETSGRAMHSADADARREAARLMGQATTEKKAAAARATAASRKGTQWTEEQKTNLRARRAELREQRQQELAVAGTAETSKEKKPAGRPRTRPVVEPTGEKRGRGRPRKQQEGAEANA